MITTEKHGHEIMRMTVSNWAVFATDEDGKEWLFTTKSEQKAADDLAGTLNRYIKTAEYVVRRILSETIHYEVTD